MHVPLRHLKRILAAIVVLALAALLLMPMSAARSRRGSADPLDPARLTNPQSVRGDIAVWGWNIAAKSLKSITPQFQERYPNVDVNIEMSGANMQTRFLLSLASNTGAPDVMQLQAYESPRYIATAG